MRLVFAPFVCLPLMAASAFGWGCDGHQIIALIASAHLTSAASAAVDTLLRENPIDPALRRLCKSRPADLMADAATWADDERNVDRATETWHYVDIPLAAGGSGADAMKWCPALPDGKPGCVVSAIETELAILRDTIRPAAARATALRYLIHFAGDIAQPLHDVDNRDRGGGCTSIAFQPGEKAQSLHAIWDSQFIARELEAAKSDQIRYAETLDRSFDGRWPEWGASKQGVLAWAWEGHQLARTIAYGALHPAIPVAPATAGPADDDACKVGREKVAAMHISIDAAYAAQAVPAIREQLAKAGYRLAGLLNRTFPAAAP